ncbi:MAG: DUF192 domain-containing protein [Candidatus Pacearchaeota archaeon]|nr:DUF192 domain-containing protein [Candidatus Pacearchaeota archaeon]
MKIVVNYKNKKLEIDAKLVRFWEMGIGLTFKRRGTRNLLFEFYKDCRVAITSLFVFFPFLIIWLDEKNNVLEHQVVSPFKFRVIPKKNFRKFLEIPINERNKEIIGFFVGK